MIKYSQIFLKDKQLAEEIVDIFNVCGGDIILEVGPGKRVLTKLLLKKQYRSFISVDIDPRMYVDSNPSKNYTHVHADILEFNFAELRELRIISNLPFCITKPFFFKIIKEAFSSIKDMLIILQYEFADGFLKNENSFCRFVSTFYEIEKVLRISKYSFAPVPKVDAVVLKFTPRNRIYEADDYVSFLQKLYTHKRKVLRNNKYISEFITGDKLSLRAQDLSDQDINIIYNAFKAVSSGQFAAH